MVKLFNAYRRLTPKEKLNVVFSTYGSLTDFSERKLGLTAVSKLFSIRLNTVYQLLKRF